MMMPKWLLSLCTTVNAEQQPQHAPKTALSGRTMRFLDTLYFSVNIDDKSQHQIADTVNVK